MQELTAKRGVGAVESLEHRHRRTCAREGGGSVQARKSAPDDDEVGMTLRQRVPHGSLFSPSVHARA